MVAVSTVGNVELVCETSARRFDPGRSPQMDLNVQAVTQFGELLEKIAEPPANTKTVWLFAKKHGYFELASHMTEVSWPDFVAEMQEYMTILDEFEAQEAEDEYQSYGAVGIN